ncbi:MAG: 4Fe-4S dicluster domain-containing protein [Desulfovibrio sp.]|nr:MAG: 4Fe-4S dicluster domain-containing protein [Desulfovibrio sp.]
MENIRYLPGVTTLRLDPEACVGCGACAEVCPHSVFRVEDRKARVVDRDACMECGACALNCPTDALAVDPGVGCAAYIIASWFKTKDGGCRACC